MKDLPGQNIRASAKYSFLILLVGSASNARAKSGKRGRRVSPFLIRIEFSFWAFESHNKTRGFIYRFEPENWERSFGIGERSGLLGMLP